jgi:prepilin-type N-terminal cleavage/methylation domain-containing protein
MRRNASATGFTLIELTMVVVIVAVGLAATAKAVTESAQIGRTTEETRAAVRSSETLMERIRATAFSEISTTYDGRTWDMETAGGEPCGTATCTVTPLDTGSSRWTVVQVTIHAEWKGVTGTRSQDFTTYVSDRTTGSPLGSTSLSLTDVAYTTTEPVTTTTTDATTAATETATTVSSTVTDPTTSTVTTTVTTVPTTTTDSTGSDTTTTGTTTTTTANVSSSASSTAVEAVTAATLRTRNPGTN